LWVAFISRNGGFVVNGSICNLKRVFTFEFGSTFLVPSACKNSFILRATSSSLGIFAVSFCFNLHVAPKKKITSISGSFIGAKVDELNPLLENNALLISVRTPDIEENKNLVYFRFVSGSLHYKIHFLRPVSSGVGGLNCFEGLIYCVKFFEGLAIANA